MRRRPPSNRFSNHPAPPCRRPSRGSFGINAWLQTELPTAGASPALGVGGPPPRPLSITPFTAALSAKRPSNDGSTPDLRPPFTPTRKLKPSYNSPRSGLQGNRDPPTGKDVHLGRPLSPVSWKKSRVSRPRSSGKSFHFPRRTFSRSPTGCPSRRFAASATPAFGDRSPFLCRRANFFCRRSTHAACPPHPPTRAYRRPDSPIPPPETGSSSRPVLPPQPDSFTTTSRPALEHSQIGRGPQPDFGFVSSAHTANFCRSFLPPSGVYRPRGLAILPDSLWHTSRFDME